jgi:hypothetical protein
VSSPTDAEVDAALEAWHLDWNAGPPEQDERSAMRAALTAAAEVRARALALMIESLVADTKRLYEDGVGSSDDLGKRFPPALNERPHNSDPTRAP